MADSAVSFLLDNVSQLLIREVGMIQGVAPAIKSLKVELALIHQFLRDSKGKRELVTEVVNAIRNVAHEAEDVIDTFVVNMAKHRRRNSFNQFIHKVDHAVMLRGVATKIEAIKNDISSIYNSRERYDIIRSEAGEDGLRRDSLNTRRRQVEEEEVVSFVKDAEAVMAMLSTKSMRLDVISIVGMGGLGKTTLAKKIYNHDFVKKRFDCRAWVYVSQEVRPRDVLLQILHQVAESTDGIQEMNEEELSNKLKLCLEDSRYLIVLDDVWKPEVWNGIKVAFPDKRNGSRILVTSRIREVASHASTTPPYLLPLLDADDSWELFTKKAFRDEVCTPAVEVYARKIAEKCNGLPLALVVVGGLLATREKSTRVLSQMVDNISWYLEKNPENFSDVLALSYDELPSHLKPCFLYLGVYPEDYEISARQLTKLWICEGFIGKDPRKKDDEVAEEYLEDLVDRSLIMVVKRRSDGGIKSCIIHDLLRDTCLTEGARENFFVVHNGNGFLKKSNNCPRRLSIHSRDTTVINCDTSLVRTLIFFSDDDRSPGKHKPSLFKNFRLVRVLHFTGQLEYKVSPKFENFVLLRYLCIKNVWFDEIPSTICNLPNLQTLDFRGSSLRSLGIYFWNLQQLRHFFSSGPSDMPTSQPSYVSHVKTMSNLETLVGVCSDHAYRIKGETYFPNLRKLQVEERSYPIPSYKQIKRSKLNFESVQTLKIVKGSHFVLHAGALSPRLTKLTLLNTKLSDLQFASFSFPNLQTLKLMNNAVVGSTGRPPNKSFGKLEVLHMVELDVNRWWIAEECMSNLRYLVINKCHNLTSVPDTLKTVTTLRHVKVYWCTSMLEGSVRALGNNIRFEFQSYKQSQPEDTRGPRMI